MIPVGPQDAGGNFDQPRRKHLRGIIALREGVAEHLLGDDNALGRHGHQFGGHAAQGMDEQELFQQSLIVAQPRLGQQHRLVAGAEAKHAADAFLLPGQIKLIDGTAVLRRGEGPCLDPAADAAQPGIGFLQRIFRNGVKPKFIQRPQRQPGAEIADGATQFGPAPTGAFQQAYFVVGEEDEIAVRICAETALGCRRAEASERRQSSLVIVLKSEPLGRAGETAALDAGRPAGERVLHGAVMRGGSRGTEKWQTEVAGIFCQVVHRLFAERGCFGGNRKPANGCARLALLAAVR